MSRGGGLLRAYARAYAGIPREVWLLAGATVVNRSGTMVLPFLSLYMTRSLGFSTTDAGVVVGLYGGGAMAGSLLGGMLADRLGAVRVQELSFVLTAAGFLVLMELRSPAALAVGVGTLAVIAEAFRPALMTAATVLAGSASRVRSLALVRLASNLGMAVGPALGGLLAVVSYRLLFIVDAATCAAAAAVLRLTVHGAERLMAGTAAPSHPEQRPWRDGPFLLLLVLVCLLGSAFFQVFTTVPIHLVAVFRFSEAGVGALLALNAVLIVLLEMPLIRTVEHLGPLRVAGVGALLVCVGLALLGIGGGSALPILAVLTWTLGEMLALPMTNAAVAERAPRGAAGRYLGAYTMAFSTASLLGPAVGAAVYQNLGPRALFGGIGVLGTLLLVGFWAVARTSPSGTAHSCGG